MMPAAVYLKFIKGYTEKQWGKAGTQLSAALAKRFDVRVDGDTRLVQHRYQALPRDGYSVWMRSILKGISVCTSRDYLIERSGIHHKRCLIFTGPIDEYFQFKLGKLAYRAQARQHQYLERPDFVLPCVQVNNPDPHNGGHVRAIEWKHMMPRLNLGSIRGSVVTLETPIDPSSPNEYEYPFPDPENQALYAQYRSLANSVPGLLICGRLGDYRYYDMDQAIGVGLRLAKRLLRS
jgi:UDP-galactopyranose mutase